MILLGYDYEYTYFGDIELRNIPPFCSYGTAPIFYRHIYPLSAPSALYFALWLVISKIGLSFCHMMTIGILYLY